MFLSAGEGVLFVEEVPLSHYVFKRCICWGLFGLSKPENSEAFFRKTFSAGAWVSEVTAEGLEKT